MKDGKKHKRGGYVESEEVIDLKRKKVDMEELEYNDTNEKDQANSKMEVVSCWKGANPKKVYTIVSQIQDQVTCPVCGDPLGALNLPFKESVVDEKLYSDGDILIVNSDIVIKCEFDHFRKEEDGTPLDDPHLLVSVIDMTFDNQGECTHFAIKEVYPAKVCNR